MSSSSNYTRSRRVGRFSVMAHLIDTNPAFFRSILSGLIIIRCELNGGTACFDYIAIGDQFDAIDMGDDAPEYHYTLNGGVKFIHVK